MNGYTGGDLNDYRGHVLRRVDCGAYSYFVAYREGQARFTATTVELLRQMIRDAGAWSR